MSKDKRTIPVPAATCQHDWEPDDESSQSAGTCRKCGATCKAVNAPSVKAAAIKLPVVTWTDPETGVVGDKPTDIEEEVVQKALVMEVERTLGAEALKMLAAYRRGIFTRAELGKHLFFKGLNR